MYVVFYNMTKAIFLRRQEGECNKVENWNVFAMCPVLSCVLRLIIEKFITSIKLKCYHLS